LHAGDAVACRHADREGEHGGRAGDDQRVEEVGDEAVRREHLRVVLTGKSARYQDRRIGGVVDLELDRERDHPDEEQDRRRHDEENRDAKRDLAEDLTRAHAPPPASFQCMRWRMMSMTAASTTMSTKNTSAIAEP